jgi:hypothetical protein
MKIRTLGLADFPKCVDLDKKWFGENGITENDLRQYIGNNYNHTVGIFDQSILGGFATFEILEKVPPKDYVGNFEVTGKILFIQQFTTATNYRVSDFSADIFLLSAVEKKAIELGCSEIWEALAVNHPYSKVLRPDFDAFGFYTSSDFIIDATAKIVWSPNPQFAIPCYLFRKKLVS